MTATPEQVARISAEEAPAAPVNEKFRSYVQSTAFSLSLGRTHITALQHLEHGIDRGLEISRWPVSDQAMAGLARRGLIADLQPEVRSKLRFTGDGPPNLWADHYEITTAGRLALLLLAEAGLIPRRAERLLPPPPPPGWTDPRPRITFDENLHVVVEPSQRERTRT